MNIEQAKTIQINSLLDKLGLTPSKTKGKELCYLSPFRSEKTPSFFVNVDKNIWHDFGDGKGGDVLSFVTSYLESTGESSNIPDALRWLKNMSGHLEFKPVQPASYSPHPESPTWVVKHSKAISHKALIQYLESRGIPIELAKEHLSEVHVTNQETRKGYFALGFQNEDGGYEVRNQHFKGSVSPKTLTFVRGSKPKPEVIHVFEGFMDFLSAVSQLKNKRLNGDAIVLNSLSSLQSAWPYIKNYGYRTLYSWLDNDPSGKRATSILKEFVASEEGLLHVPMNRLYLSHKDVNAWHMHRLNLS